MKTGDLVAFIANSRFEEWKRGDMAHFERYLVKKPLNQETIAVLTTYPGDKTIWALEGEFRPHFEQLSLF